MIWSKSTQTLVGIVVGCVAAAGIHVIANPVAADQTTATSTVPVVMAAEPAAEPAVSFVDAAIVVPSATTRAAPEHQQMPKAVAVAEAGQPARTTARTESASPSKPTPPDATEPPPPPTEEPHHHHHHDPPKPPKG